MPLAQLFEQSERQQTAIQNVKAWNLRTRASVIKYSNLDVRVNPHTGQYVFGTRQHFSSTKSQLVTGKKWYNKSCSVLWYRAIYHIKNILGGHGIQPWYEAFCQFTPATADSLPHQHIWRYLYQLNTTHILTISLTVFQYNFKLLNSSLTPSFNTSLSPSEKIAPCQYVGFDVKISAQMGRSPTLIPVSTQW